jgi:hypothetical protein
MFILAELLKLPGLLDEARRGPLMDHELKEALGSIKIDDDGKETGR